VRFAFALLIRSVYLDNLKTALFCQSAQIQRLGLRILIEG
jgi:hypothetical protein